MLQLMPGLFYVVIITAVFTILLVSFTAVFLLTQARAIVRKRYLGELFSSANTRKVLKVRPLLATAAGMLVSVKAEDTNRLLTTFKRPAQLRLYTEFFYVRPLFSTGAYLIPLTDILESSLADGTLVIAFTHDDHKFLLQCASYNLSKWSDALNRLVRDHKYRYKQ